MYFDRVCWFDTDAILSDYDVHTGVVLNNDLLHRFYGLNAVSSNDSTKREMTKRQIIRLNLNYLRDEYTLILLSLRLHRVIYNFKAYEMLKKIIIMPC